MFLLHFLASIHLSNLNFIHRSLCHKLPQIYRRPGVNRELSDQFTDQSRKLSPRRIVGVFSSRIDTIRLAVSPEQRAPSSRSTRACSSPNPGHARASVLFENRAWEKKRGDRKPRDQKKKKEWVMTTRQGREKASRHDTIIIRVEQNSTTTGEPRCVECVRSDVSRDVCVSADGSSVRSPACKFAAITWICVRDVYIYRYRDSSAENRRVSGVSLFLLLFFVTLI